MASQASDVAAVLTIGHSNHPLDRFLGLLRQHEVDVLVDARSQPVSRFSPHFSRNALDRAVTELSIGYLFMGDALGGRPSARECYDAEGKVDYDRIEAQPFYQRGIEQLLDGIARFRVCVMCAEEDPSRCHRRLLIARTLMHRGVDVLHVRKTGTIVTEQELRAMANPNQLSLPAEAGRPSERTRR